MGIVGEGRPAGLGRGEGNPAGNCEVKPAGLGSCDARPVELGVPKPATPGVMLEGAAGCGTGRTERLGVWAWPIAAAPASKAAAQPRRKAQREVDLAFTAAFLRAAR